jgi:hypothetical protein
MLKTTIALAFVLCSQAVFAESINGAESTPAPQPSPAFATSSGDASNSAFASSDKERLKTMTDDYYSAKRGAILYNVLGTGLYVVGDIVATSACTEKATGYYGETTTDCNSSQLLTGIGMMVAAVPFEVLGVVKIVQSFVRGNQLRREEEHQGVNPVAVVPTYNPRNKALGLVTVASF